MALLAIITVAFTNLIRPYTAIVFPSLVQTGDNKPIHPVDCWSKLRGQTLLEIYRAERTLLAPRDRRLCDTLDSSNMNRVTGATPEKCCILNQHL